MAQKSIVQTGCIGCFGVVAMASILMVGAGVYFVKQEVDYFSAHRSEIIAAVEKDLDEGRYEAVISTAEKYEMVGDPELARLRSEAESQLISKRAESIKVKLSGESSVATRVRLLEELKELQPGDEQLETQYVEAKINLLSQRLATEEHSEMSKIRILEELNRLEPQNAEWRDTLIQLRTKELSGYIRYECKVFSEPSEESTVIGYLTPPSTAEVTDTGSPWLRLRFGPVKDVSSNEFLDLPFDSGVFIKKSHFTTELPANW